MKVIFHFVENIIKKINYYKPLRRKCYKSLLKNNIYYK